MNYKKLMHKEIIEGGCGEYTIQMNGTVDAENSTSIDNNNLQRRRISVFQPNISISIENKSNLILLLWNWSKSL